MLYGTTESATKDKHSAGITVLCQHLVTIVETFDLQNPESSTRTSGDVPKDGKSTQKTT